MKVPEDTLLDVFNFLESRDKLKALLVNKTWHTVCSQSKWVVEERDIVQKYSITEETMGWARRLNVTGLVLQSPVVATGLLKSIGEEEGERVRTLKVTCELSPACWADIWRSMKNLTALDIQVFAPPDEARFESLQTLSANAIPKASHWNALPVSLQSLSLSHVSDSSLTSQYSRFTSLTSLSLASCDEVTQTGFLAIAKNCKKLKSIDLSGTRIDAFSLDQLLKSTTSLASLYLQDCTNLNDTDGKKKSAPATTKVQKVANLFAELKAVTPKVQTHVPASYKDEQEAETTDSATGFLSAGLGSLLSQRTGLECLALGGVGMLDDSGLRMILKSLKNLRVLKLNKNREITDDAFVDSDVVLPKHLHTLTLSSCIQLTDETLRTVSQLPLRLLSISGCLSMTPVGVRHVIKGCPSLRSFYAFSMGSEGIPSNGLPHQKIRLFSDDLLQDLWTYIPNLESFGISSYELSAAAFPLKPYGSLSTLNIQYCCTSNDAYRAVADAFPNLVRLNIQSKDVPIENAVMSELLRKLPRLTTVRACMTSIEPLTPLLTERRMQTIDLEYFGSREVFALKAELWWDFISSCKARHIDIFLGNRASHYLND
eukprot:TRINITY_DN33546_c0_g1_i1.p1 TRINITY_DN33546_c0_g1~~TRINITY_DN33546_c0_g1_i1.p1  ORF type:complete len:600 (+),score=118.02 TRINITY_DN33546_c0_g1_i1:44-1843(+)